MMTRALLLCFTNVCPLPVMSLIWRGGKEALTKVPEVEPDLIVLDIMLPVAVFSGMWF